MEFDNTKKKEPLPKVTSPFMWVQLTQLDQNLSDMKPANTIRTLAWVQSQATFAMQENHIRNLNQNPNKRVWYHNIPLQSPIWVRQDNKAVKPCCQREYSNKNLLLEKYHAYNGWIIIVLIPWKEQRKRKLFSFILYIWKRKFIYNSDWDSNPKVSDQP